MSLSLKRIGVLTGGGDAPGLNAAIRSVVKTSINRYGWSVLGIEDGFEGLLGETTIRQLTIENVRGLLPLGGSILGCTNKGHFGIKDIDGHFQKNDAAYDQALKKCRQLELDALVVIGGEGSQRIAYELSKMGLSIIGIPKTIDNDLDETDSTIGFDTARAIATEAIDRLHTTADSHDRVILVEVMGRYAGWIALECGIAGGADVILIPEIPFDIDKVASKVMERQTHGRLFSIIIVAEGARASGGSMVYQERGNAERTARLGGIAECIAGDLARIINKDCRVSVLGHLQRGGSPTAFDRLLASSFGSAAVAAIAQGKFGHLVAWKSNEVTTVSLEQAVRNAKVVQRDNYLINVARGLGMTFAGDEDQVCTQLKVSGSAPL